MIKEKQRVLQALRFDKPDRIPSYDSYWPEFVQAWQQEKQMPLDADITDYYQNDVEIVIPAEAPFPQQEGLIEQGKDWKIVRSDWGAVVRTHTEAKFSEVLDVALSDRSQLDSLVFESPLLDSRYPPIATTAALKRKRCVFIKTGGPYLRTSNLRGMTNWLMDLADDPVFAKELAMRVTRHITAVGLEALRRYDLFDTGIWFFDDMGCNRGPMFSPATFEKVFYPCYKWMCDQYKNAGVGNILLHCDGNIEPILDMLMDAGINGCHPMEPKAGMDVVRLRQKYGRRLAFIGGLDNAHTLVRAPLPEVEHHVRQVLEIGTEGGLIIGAHSIGPDISIERYDFVHNLIRTFGGVA